MKILFLTILSVLILSASNTDHQVKIIEKIISQISLKKQIYIWSDDKNILNKLEKNNKLLITHNCQEATFIILRDKHLLSKVCSKAHIFVLNYQLLSDLPQSFGALFWKKGRPNIVILAPRIQAQNIKISKALEPYLEDKLW